MRSVDADEPVTEMLRDGWRHVLVELARAARLCVHGVNAPDGPVPRQRRGDPSRRLKRRQHIPLRQRHLHHLHCSLLALEVAADTATRLAVAVELRDPARIGQTQDVDEAVRAFEAAVAELAATTRRIVD
jgi:hypothetical protein